MHGAKPQTRRTLGVRRSFTAVEHVRSRFLYYLFPRSLLATPAQLTKWLGDRVVEAFGGSEADACATTTLTLFTLWAAGCFGAGPRNLETRRFFTSHWRSGYPHELRSNSRGCNNIFTDIGTITLRGKAVNYSCGGRGGAVRVPTSQECDSTEEVLRPSHALCRHSAKGRSS